MDQTAWNRMLSNRNYLTIHPVPYPSHCLSFPCTTFSFALGLCEVLIIQPQNTVTSTPTHLNDLRFSFQDTSLFSMQYCLCQASFLMNYFSSDRHLLIRPNKPLDSIRAVAHVSLNNVHHGNHTISLITQLFLSSNHQQNAMITYDTHFWKEHIQLRDKIKRLDIYH